ncbi:MAG: exodeoxyribonuclease V subunit alpha [Oxalobacter sp.]|nr:exodeoxyribonuclease V subunit alpha [Oxalobacter sp.]
METDIKNMELSEETGDRRTSDDRQADNTRQAVDSYAAIHLAMMKRQPDWWCQWSSHEAAISQALGYVYRALSKAGAAGSLCVTLQRVVETVSTRERTVSLESVSEAVDLLMACGLIVDQSSAENGNVPLVYDPEPVKASSRIYFRRYWWMEKRLAQLLVSFAKAGTAGKASFSKLDQLEPSSSERRKAIERALDNRLSIISGGPGTGKTTAVARILECLLASDPTLRIVLAAPTGKAAGRMLESVRHSIAGKTAFECLAERESKLVAHTMHKWLADPQANGLRPSAEKPLDCDVLVIDESSMVDIELAVRFLSVIDAGRTRVILLGDPYQLEAVGPGSILADICDDDSPLKKGYVSELTVSHRFPESSPLGQLAGNIKMVREDKDIFIPPDSGILNHLSSSGPLKGLLSSSAQNWLDGHIAAYADAVKAYLSHQDVSALWDSAKRFQALAATRHGKMSVDAINDYAQERLGDALKGLKLDAQSGQIIIVRKNNSVLDIYNGDVGIVLPQSASDTSNSIVYFGDRQKTLALGRLPQYEPAFAITIHQSQGSEYEDVAVFLPSGEENQLATKELLYTAVTRVKVDSEQERGTLALFGEQFVYNRAVKRATERTSGLKARLEEAFQWKGS